MWRGGKGREINEEKGRQVERGQRERHLIGQKGLWRGGGAQGGTISPPPPLRSLE